MVNYTCVKCGKSFDQKGTYNYHINRKTPCITESIKTDLEKKIDNLEYIVLQQNEQLKKIMEFIESLEIHEEA